MKGYTPNFKNISKKELSSKTSKGFIELGVFENHNDDCECYKCKEAKEK